MPERRKSGSTRRARAPWSVWRRCSLLTGRREHVRRSRLAIQTEALSRDMPEYLNRLLTRWAPAGALCAQAAHEQHLREKVPGATEGVGTLLARVLYISADINPRPRLKFSSTGSRLPLRNTRHFTWSGRTVSQNASDAKIAGELADASSSNRSAGNRRPLGQKAALSGSCAIKRR